MTAEQVQAQMITFLFAGPMAIVAVLMLMIKRLADHTPVQERLRAEMQALGPDPPATVIAQAPFLDAIFLEATRTNDAAPLEREATRDDVLPLAEPVVLKDGSVVTEIPVRTCKGFSCVAMLDVTDI